jgi:ribosomal protein S4
MCVKSPSFLIKPGDEITFKDKYVELAKKIKEVTKEYITIPAFLNILAEDPPRIRVIANPTMQDARVSFNMQYVVEYYTR